VAVLVDEAVALIVEAPGRWLRVALLPAVPMALIALAYVQAHRSAWVHEPWEGTPALGSALFGLALTVAYLARGVGHGAVAREVVARLHPAAARPTGRLPVFSLCCAAAIGATATLVGAGMLLLPAFFFAGRFADLPGALAVEGRGVAGGLVRPRPMGTLFKATRATALSAGVGLLVWANLVAGANIVVVLLRALTGVDAGVLAAAVSPTNGAFLITAAIFAGLIVEPLWAVVRALLYLDARLGRSGADLTDRWSAAISRRGGGVALAVALLLSASPGRADDGVTPEEYADRLARHRAEVDEAVAAYAGSGWESLGALHDEADLTELVGLPGGDSVFVDGSVLLGELPREIHSDGTRADAVRTADTLARAEAAARALGRSTPAQGPSAEALLDRVLAEGDIDQSVRGATADRRRDSLREKIASWWDSLFVEEPVASRRTRSSLPFDLRWVGAAAALLAVAALLVLLGVRFADPAARLRLRDRSVQGPGLSALPDARSRTPGGWTESARALRDQGRLREAVRAHFLAVLAALDRRREIDYRPEHTNGALLRGYRGDAAGLERFEWATGAFERAWYGEDDPDLPQVQAMEAACAPLVHPEARP